MSTHVETAAAKTGAAQQAVESSANGADASGATAVALQQAPATATAAVAAAITPLAVPWLHHDSFPTIKKVCSESGLPQAKKTSVVRVLQELKKGRNRIGLQLVHLETQLLHVSDFLSGVAPTLEIAPDVSTAAASEAETAVGNGKGIALNGTCNGQSPEDAVGDKAAPMDPVATLVEEDLVSDAPCTTVGLWRYLSVFPYFKTVTLEDMQEALLLEDPALGITPEAMDAEDTDSVDAYEAVDGLPALDEDGVLLSQSNCYGDAKVTVNDLLRMRLLAALISDDAQDRNSNGHCVDVQADFSMKENGDAGDVAMDDSEHEIPLPPQVSSSRTVQQLRDVGLVEASTEEVAQSLANRHDDEVSCEIRLLQNELVRQVRRSNEVKRMLRRALERRKPWLTHHEEHQQIETKFEKMWRRKKELQRKRKHKEKKLQRKEASYKSALVIPSQPHVES